MTFPFKTLKASKQNLNKLEFANRSIDEEPNGDDILRNTPGRLSFDRNNIQNVLTGTPLANRKFYLNLKSCLI